MEFEGEYLFHSTILPTENYKFFEAKREEFCDIALKVGDRTISAHRIILSAAVPYFYKMFSNKSVKDSQEMTLPDVDSVALESLIEFAYTCKVKINMGSVKELLHAACVLQVDEVRNACCCFLERHLDFENVLNIREYSSTLRCMELLEKIDLYIRGNFEDISISRDFLDVPFALLIELIARDDLQVKCEENLFEIVMKWVKHYPNERLASLPQLLRNIRLPFIKPAYIKNRIQKEPVIRSSTECRDLLEEAVYYHLMPEEREEVCSFSTRLRRFTGCEKGNVETAFIYVVQCCQEKHQIECLDLGKDQWQTPEVRDFVLKPAHTASELNKKIYFFLPNLTYIYDLLKDNVSFSNGMAFPRTLAGSTSHQGKLYVCGGFAKNSPSSTVECFDPMKEEWTTLTPMNIPREALGVVASGIFIYAVGGTTTGRHIVNSAERYDLSTSIWTMMPPMLTKRYLMGCAVLHNKIYVCGGMSVGETVLSTAEVFDSASDQWKYIFPLNTANYGWKLISHGSKLYALGGRKLGTASAAVEIYEPEKDKWAPGKSLTKGSDVVAAVVVSFNAA